MDRSSLIVIRDSLPDDHNFIMATWLLGLYHGNDWFSKIDKSTFMDNYHPILETVLKRSTTTTKVAALKEDESVILGYAVFDIPRLHWVHVKEAWRKIGIARSLVPEDITTCTHLTRVGNSIRKQIRFNPFQL